MCPKVMDWAGPPPPLRENYITNPFFFMASLSEGCKKEEEKKGVDPKVCIFTSCVNSENRLQMGFFNTRMCYFNFQELKKKFSLLKGVQRDL